MDRALDTLVLAGNLQGYVRVGGVPNKALLPLGGLPMVRRVLSELSACRNSGRIYLVGPSHELDFLRDPLAAHQVEVIEQEGGIIENVLHAWQVMKTAGSRAPILVVPADMPLVRADEIDYFIEHSGCDSLDYVLGFASAEALSPYWPDPEAGNPGIRQAYVYFRQFAGRLNNLHIVNPEAFERPGYIGRIYNIRYQKRLRNYLRFVKEVMGVEGQKWRLLKLSLLMQMTLQADRFGLLRLARGLGQWIDVREVEAALSQALGVRFGIKCMQAGASALDVDNDRDYGVLAARYEEWSALAEEAVKRLRG